MKKISFIFVLFTFLSLPIVAVWAQVPDVITSPVDGQIEVFLRTEFLPPAGIWRMQQWGADGCSTAQENFTDNNGNGQWDGEIFHDLNLNGIWDHGEELIDLNGNGVYDANNNEPFVDANNNNQWDDYEDNTLNALNVNVGTHCLSNNQDRFAWDCNLGGDADNNLPVYAIEDGEIVRHFWGHNNNYGQLLLRHTRPDGEFWYSGYAHMNKTNNVAINGIPRLGVCVKKGDIIGNISNICSTCTNLPNHLHFAIYDNNGQYVSQDALIVPRDILINDGMLIYGGRSDLREIVEIRFKVYETSQFPLNGVNNDNNAAIITNLRIGQKVTDANECRSNDNAGNYVTVADNHISNFRDRGNREYSFQVDLGTYNALNENGQFYDIKFNITNGNQITTAYGEKLLYLLSTNYFTDIGNTNDANWFRPYIERGIRKGLIGHRLFNENKRVQNISNNYQPGEMLTRKEMAEVVVTAARKLAILTQSDDDIDNDFAFNIDTRFNNTLQLDNGQDFDLPEDSGYFGDVCPTHPYFIYIQTLRNNGIVNGYKADTDNDGNVEPTNQFGPDDPVTRAQLSKFLVKAFDIDLMEAPDCEQQTCTNQIQCDENGEITYHDGELCNPVCSMTDLDNAEWYFGYVNTLVNSYIDDEYRIELPEYENQEQPIGSEYILRGRSCASTTNADGSVSVGITFAPQGEVLRAEMAKFIVNTFDFKYNRLVGNNQDENAFAPQNVNLVYNAPNIEIAWDAPQIVAAQVLRRSARAASPTILQYNIYRNDVLLANVSADNNNYIDSDINPQNEYCYFVKAVFDNGEGPASEKPCITPVIETPVINAGDYANIQEAINATTEAGIGTVLVPPGTYVENITIKDGVWLTSTSDDPADTIIDGNGIHDVIVIHGSDTGGIIGFTIQNSQQNGQFAGIKCEGNETLTIANCIIKNNNHGIKFGGNSEPLIVNNVITQNIGDGIHTTGNPAGTLYNNIITQNQGVAIYISGKNTLTTSYNNLWENGEGKKNQNDTVTGLGNIAEDPAFLNPEFGEYHLVSGSPCIDTGHPKYEDPDGTPSDMGVYGGTWKNLAQTPPADVKEATTLTVTLDCPDADLTLYAPDERACGKDVSQIPEAKHETNPNGGQSVSVKKPEKGNYRAVLKGNTDQDCNLTVTTFMDDAELSTETRLVKVKNHKSVRANIPLNYPAEYPRFTFGTPGASKKPDGSELKGDLNGDGEVDVEDVMKAASKWNKKAGDPDFDAFYDFDEDGDIDLDDVMHISDDWFVYEP